MVTADTVVVPLAECRRDDRDLVGGKAAQLGQCVLWDFTVPRGCVVTATAWHRRIDGQLDAATQESLQSRLRVLSGELFAVRSSAIFEDGATTAWAGQLSTFLSVPRERIIEKVTECMRSLEREVPRAYGKHFHIETVEMPVPVLVQEMVHAEISGVIFSKHPVTQDNHVMVVEAVRGLGDALVSGFITPDTYEVARNTNVVTVVHQVHQEQRLLSDAVIRTLVSLASDLEQKFGFPVDVEWAYAEGECIVLQCRPITTR
jgi:pyruvate,water dikinase